MLLEGLQRLSTFAKWPMSSDAFSGTSNFASKAAGAHFERTADSVNDEVVCQSCAVRFSAWSSEIPASECMLYECPAAVHRVISPRCPALNPSDHDTLTEESVTLWHSDLSSLLNSPFAKYLPSHIRPCCATPEQPSSPTEAQRTATVRRQLFPEPHQLDDQGDRTAHHQEGNSQGPEAALHQNVTTPNFQQQPSVLDQTPITHPFRPQTGNYDHLCASQRLQTFPQPTSNAKFQTWAEEGFVYRREEQDVMCVYCGTVLVVNGHQPGAVHRKVCPSCPFVMGFDVGNVSQRQEQFIRLVYLKQQAGKKQSDFEIKHVQHEKEDDRLGTFQGWPKMCAKIFPASVMASAGFFYSGCSDKVVCYCCGVELYDWSEEADVWRTHATVSPACLHIINTKGQEFIAQAADQQVLAEVKRPRDSSAGESGSGGGVGEEPGCAILDMTAIKAALACGYTLLQIQHAILKFFCQTSRYPNEAILKASLKATDENYITICEKQQVVLQKDTQLQQTYTQLQQKDTQLQQKGAQLQQKDTQLQQKDTQLQQNEQTVSQLNEQLNVKDEQLNVKDEQLNAQGEQLNEKNQQLNEKNQQLNVKEEQLNESLQQLSAQEEQLRMQEEQIQSLMQQVQRLRADRHHRAVLAPGPQGEGAIPARPGQGDHQSQPLVCKICMADRPRMIFLPCGHLFSCAQCTSRLPDRRCPVCRQDVSQVLPAFVA